jgi:CheY-like chemotaxis protein
VGTLPVSTAERDLAGLHSTPEPEEGRALHILLIEDHTDTASALIELLSGIGHTVSLAGDVSQGLAVAAEATHDGHRAIDLVVSDLGLPDGSGLDLMRELSSRYQLKGIALSGYGMEEDLKQSRAAGFDLHLTKPIRFQDLVAAIDKIARLAALAGNASPPA